jgi:hypothetical protein
MITQQLSVRILLLQSSFKFTSDIPFNQNQIKKVAGWATFSGMQK